MLTFLDGLTPWMWIGWAFLIGILELSIPSTIFVWPALAALIVGILSFLLPGLFASGFYQIILFVVLSIVIAIVGRLLISVFGKGGSGSSKVILNDPLQRNIGKIGTVASIDGTEGIAIIDGVRWHFRLNSNFDPQLPVSKIKIVAVNQSTLIADPVDTNSPL
ncbi:MAG: hypothetical protein OXC02_08710 [Rhodobacteraceae bacterium]|nr:hypothetical protein [Paracoccaceae bacterium]